MHAKIIIENPVGAGYLLLGPYHLGAGLPHDSCQSWISLLRISKAVLPFPRGRRGWGIGLLQLSTPHSSSLQLVYKYPSFHDTLRPGNFPVCPLTSPRVSSLKEWEAEFRAAGLITSLDCLHFLLSHSCAPL